MSLLDLLWSVTKFLLTGLCLPLALFIFYTSSNRAIIEKYPNSIVYKVLKILDAVFVQVIKATEIDDPKINITAEPATTITDLHSYIGLEKVVSIRRAFTASIDLSRFLSERHVGRFGSVEVLFFAVYLSVAAIAPIGAISVNLAFSFDSRVGLWGTLLSMGLMGAVLIYMLNSKDSILTVLMKLIANRSIVFSVDNKMISTFSGWGHYVFKNDGSARMIAKTSGLVHGIGFEANNMDGTKVHWIIRVPSFVMEKAFKERQLEELCQKLNVLASNARNVSDVLYDEIEIDSRIEHPEVKPPSA